MIRIVTSNKQYRIVSVNTLSDYEGYYDPDSGLVTVDPKLFKEINQMTTSKAIREIEKLPAI